MEILVAARVLRGLVCVHFLASLPRIFNPKMAEPLKLSFQLLDLGSVTSKFNLQASVPLGHKTAIDWAEILSLGRPHAQVTSDQ